MLLQAQGPRSLVGGVGRRATIGEVRVQRLSVLCVVRTRCLKGGWRTATASRVGSLRRPGSGGCAHRSSPLCASLAGIGNQLGQLRTDTLEGRSSVADTVPLASARNTQPAGPAMTTGAAKPSWWRAQRRQVRGASAPLPHHCSQRWSTALPACSSTLQPNRARYPRSSTRSAVPRTSRTALGWAVIAENPACTRVACQAVRSGTAARSSA